jgi:hypothetical protein
VLNLIERRYQQQRLSVHPPDPARIRHMISMIHAFSTVSAISAVAFAVLAITWLTKRRSRARLNQYGEAAVEPRLRDVSPVLYWTIWCLLAASFLLNATARSLVHTGMTPQNFATYRAYLAVGGGVRTGFWSCWIALIAVASQAQDRREALPVPASDPNPGAVTEAVRSAIRVGAVAMLAAGNPESEAARAAVFHVMRAHGLENYDTQWLSHDLNGIGPTQIWPYLAPLQGVDWQQKSLIVEQIAAVGLADGALTPPETSVLEATAAALGLGPADLHQIVTNAPRAHDWLAPDGTAEPPSA